MPVNSTGWKRIALVSLGAALLVGSRFAYLRVNLYADWRGVVKAANPAEGGLILLSWPHTADTPRLLTAVEVAATPTVQFGGEVRPVRFSGDMSLPESRPVRIEWARSLDEFTYSGGWLLGSLLLGAAGFSWKRSGREAAQEEAEAQESISPGGRVGEYRLLREVGQGATGAVWEARDAAGARVAIKVLHEAIVADESSLQRFEREFAVARRFSHPRVVRCQAMGQVADSRYIVMDFLDNGSLRDILDKGRVPVRQALQYALEITEGIAYAHEMGVMHRDLKPENILVDSAGHLAIADFGLARANDSSTITVTGTVLGTPAYMAPDQLRGEKYVAPSDLYGIGVILYELLAGHIPFQQEDLMQMFVAHMNQAPPSLQEACPEAPAEIVALVSGLLEKQPGDRPQSASEVARVLRSCL